MSNIDSRIYIDKIKKLLRESIGIINKIEGINQSTRNNFWGMIFQAYIYAIIAYVVKNYNYRNIKILSIEPVLNNSNRVFKFKVSTLPRTNHSSDYSYIRIKLKINKLTDYISNINLLLLFNTDVSIYDNAILNLDIALVFSTRGYVNELVPAACTVFFAECKARVPDRLREKSINPETVAAFIGQYEIVRHGIQMQRKGYWPCECCVIGFYATMKRLSDRSQKILRYYGEKYQHSCTSCIDFQQNISINTNTEKKLEKKLTQDVLPCIDEVCIEECIEGYRRISIDRVSRILPWCGCIA